MTRLRQLRLVAGLRQSDLAERAGVSRETIRLLETGDHMPRLDTAHRIAIALDLGEASAAFPELLDPAGDYFAHNDQERPPGALGGKVADDRGQPAEV